MLANKRSIKLVVFFFAAAILIALWLPSTAIPARSSDYIKGIINKSASNKGVPADAVAPPVLDDSTPTPTSTSTYNPFDPTPNPLAPTDVPGYNFDKWFFQADIVNNPLPKWDLSKLKALAPRHYRGPGHETYATYYASRNPTDQDPYYLAAQQIVFRLLWDQRSKTHKYPVTVFVAPFVPQSHRDHFLAAGALVRELPLVPFTPNNNTVHLLAGRLVDMFSKLQMWNQTDYSRIGYMDSDAFPLVNVDDIFDLAHEQYCNETVLPEPDDATNPHHPCDYVFTGHGELGGGTINAGVLVFKPNEGLFDMLMRDSKDTTKYDNGLAEQAFMNYFFRLDGPFPWEGIPERFNAAPIAKDEGREVSILHGKIWSLFQPPEYWASPLFDDTWKTMLDFYESESFLKLREQDDAQALAEIPA